MLETCAYNKVKLLHELCSLAWFIDKHALPDAKASGDDQLYAVLDEVLQGLNKNIKKIKEVKENI